MKILSFCILTGVGTGLLMSWEIHGVQAQPTTPLPPATEPLAQSSDRNQPPTDPPIAQPSSSPPVNSATREDLKSPPTRLQVPTQPQQVEVQKTVEITLDQAIAIVEQNSLTFRITQLQLNRVRAALRETEASLYPTLGFQSTFSRDISASGDISTNVSRQQLNKQIDAGQVTLQNLLDTPIPADPNDALLLQQSIEQTQAKLSQGQTSLDALQNYGTASFNNSLSLNYTIFTSGRRPAVIQAAKEQVRLSELEVERTREQLRLDVTNAYYDVQSANEQVRIEAASVDESTRSLKNAEVLSKNGLATRLDVLNAQVQLDNALQQLASAESQQQASRRQLSRLLNAPPTITVAAADPVKVADQWQMSLEESIVQALQKRVELQQQIAQRNISINQRKAARAALRPQVSMFASYSVLGFGNDTPGDAATRGWGKGYSLGLSASWSLYDGGASRARAAQETENIAIAETQFAETSNQIRFDVEQNYFSLRSNLKNVQTATTSLDRAKEALRIARFRFGAGVGTQTDVLDTESRLTRAESNLVQAILGYNRALAALRRAVSNLPQAKPSK